MHMQQRWAAQHTDAVSPRSPAGEACPRSSLGKMVQPPTCQHMYSKQLLKVSSAQKAGQEE